ncbi:winged helix-turn-helix transcriptional regulator [Flavobacterium rakeshii]|uniref:Winged helix-turn-helix transcriptional regulator n=2 Tax=Flavobacterium rakeshii TaxID=1038845 RepID=A0A6N8HFC6_9FLAO|nr:Lrp/AsnC family transcriptional regulator [Flavobacterium rakeshii]MUV04424.1 winged helix-turn-helix transcriptional regulator [Flavobacterium rakeshii]
MELLDETDLKLLKILHENSSYTTKELAQMVNLSPSPVFERVKKLEKNGYIKKYIAILDAEKLNQGFAVFTNIKLKQHDRSIGHKFVEDIMNIEEVIECYNISGDYDFLLKVIVRDMKHYQDFVFNKLGSVKSIGSTHSMFVMSEIKNSYGAGVPLN